MLLLLVCLQLSMGYTNVDQNDEGASDDTGGSSWYIGATMSF